MQLDDELCLCFHVTKRKILNHLRVHQPRVPSQLSEDDLKVTAVIKADHEVSAGELFEWCVTQLPYFALPRYIEFRDDLPRSPVGRVLKRELREEGVTPNTWDAEAEGVDYERR